MQGVDCHAVAFKVLPSISTWIQEVLYYNTTVCTNCHGDYKCCYIILRGHSSSEEKGGCHHYFAKDITEHLIDAKSIDWEGMYVHSTPDLNSGAT
jgi:hypothetical protein